LLPLWSLLLPLSIPPALVFLRHRRLKHRRRRGLCLNCGYDLRASKDVCSECGASIPAKPDVTPSVANREKPG
jgi:predicted amidophosphoribosyltransferase